MRQFMLAGRMTALLLLLAGCSTQTPPPFTPSTAPTEIGSTVSVGLQSWPAVIEVQGSLYGDEQAVVGTKVAGLVETVKVDIGSIVKQGDTLATLEMEDFDLRILHAEAQVEQSRAKLGLRPGEDDAKLDRLKAPPVRQEQTMYENAKGKVDRERALRSQGAGTVELLQDAEAMLRVAKAKLDSSLNFVEEQVALLNLYKQELAQAKQSRTDATIRAPFDGVVQHRYAASGVYMPIGASVISLVRTNPLRFRSGVPEREALRVAVGQSVKIDIKGLKDPIAATISRIAPALELNSRALTIEADIPNADSKLRSGLFAQGEIIVDPASQTIAVPLSTITEFAGVEKVWKVENNEVREVRIRTGRRDKDRVEIVSGLKAGDVILAEPRR